MGIRAGFLIFLVCFLSVAWAEDHGGGEQQGSGGHEAPAGGDKGGDGKEAAKEGGGEVKTSLAPWVEIENKIQELYSKIKSKESAVLHLLEEKDHLADNSPQLKHTVREIVKEHKELRRLVEDYQKNISILKYRFPERNAKQTRTYDRVEVKTIDEMEKALGIDGKLSRNMKKMRSQYKPEEKPVAHQPSTVIPEPAPKKDPSIEEAHSIILQK